ncbi:hypothetical protein P8A21_15185 [Streptomyces poriferorum]|uniref:Uncharacterized protein n=1 Tax=Streptomyces poriferorum TaxID=2798799 RepID=A0ABY9IU18_9ACTN|nr:MULTISPECIES: hypothetical protein [Streptomyces]WSQ46026.1 hypothetical protein OG345_25060 [Streptomyces sp. NBC_01220]MBW5251894.1 hypothetical protein [Streptomyces poriferorum]MBW5258213.1 hypothetical protein [Streptomyces poriferorum]MDP5312394.1 hypothetical protein [Streptomyces sp. Alt4]WLQ48753.1 hypothetical protein P8A21_15185 [Streptomyces sp. Alt1]
MPRTRYREPIPSSRWGDRGATAFEYLGTILVIVALIGGMAAAGLGGQITDRIQCLVSSIGGGSAGCGGGKEGEASGDPNAEFEPLTCATVTKAGTQGGKFGVSFETLGIEFGGEFGFEETTTKAKTDVNKDGKIDDNDEQVSLTFTDAGSIKGTEKPKARIKIGDVGKDKVELGAGLTVTTGDTWVFDSQEEADQFRKDLEEYKKLSRLNKLSNLSPIIGGSTEIASWFGKGPKAKESRLKDNIEDKLGNKHITTQKISLEVAAQAGFQFGAGMNAPDTTNPDGTTTPAPKPGATVEAGLKISGSHEVTLTQNHINNTDAYTYQAKATGGAYAKGEAGPAKAGAEAAGSAAGAITVTVDSKTGKVKSITMTRTLEGKAEASAGLKGDVNGNAKGGGTTTQVITTTVPLDDKNLSQAESDAIKAQMFSGQGMNSAFNYLFTGTPVPTKDPGAGDPFGHYAFNHGQVSKQEYDGSSSSEEIGLDINLEIAGINGAYTTSETEKSLTKAEFLGAPSGGQRAFFPYSYCAK